MSATFQCCTCGEAVGSYHRATCVRRGQVLPSEAPGCIEAAVAVRYWTDLAQAEARDAAALRTRVAELERALADAVAIAREFDARQQKAEARVAELEAERDEAVAALRGLLRKEWYIYEGNLEAAGHASVDDLNAARAVLAKYPEGR